MRDVTRASSRTFRPNENTCFLLAWNNITLRTVMVQPIILWKQHCDCTRFNVSYLYSVLPENKCFFCDSAPCHLSLRKIKVKVLCLHMLRDCSLDEPLLVSLRMSSHSWGKNSPSCTGWESQQQRQMLRPGSQISSASAALLIWPDALAGPMFSSLSGPASAIC